MRTGWGKDDCGDGKEGMELRESGGKNPHICFFSSRLVVTSPNLTVPLLFFFIYYFWLHWVFVAACGLSLVVASGGCCSL